MSGLHAFLELFQRQPWTLDVNHPVAVGAEEMKVTEARLHARA